MLVTILWSEYCNVLWMAKQLIGVASSCNVKAGFSKYLQLSPLLKLVAVWVSSGWACLSTSSASCGLLMKTFGRCGGCHCVSTSGWTLCILIKDERSLFWIILPMLQASLVGEEICRAIGCAGVFKVSTCESWVAYADFRAQVCSFLGWGPGWTLPAELLPGWSCSRLQVALRLGS